MMGSVGVVSGVEFVIIVYALSAQRATWLGL